MVELFESTAINTMTLSNRFVRSATWMGMATEDGSVTPRLVDAMVKLAKGGVGLIITGLTCVHRSGWDVPWQLGIYSDEHIAGLTEMVEAVHAVGGKIAVQIAHAGVQGNSQRTGTELLGPSIMEGKEGPLCREMTPKDIHEIVTAFKQAATRAKTARFDALQLHGAHGYLLSEFLSPFFNKRTDEYGGSVENRARFVLEVYQSVRDAVGDQFPVMIKLNSEDLVEGGLRVDDMLQVAGMLEAAGIEAIELSGGISRTWTGDWNKTAIRIKSKDVYYIEAAKQYKKQIGVPLMLVGGIHSFEVAEQLVQEGITDYVALSRPLIREPHLINRWRSGDTRKATCISDNACFNLGSQGIGVRCVHIDDG